ncbi:MAG: hypothetical protein HRT46_11580 [Deltaproteobacteria bacterium]|nr:hypothetical protein [Deltaproteobacteria bacterium]
MASERVTISWDRPMLERFKVAHAKAPGDADSEFTFEGNTFVKGYAKYLIEFLEPELPTPI